MKKVDSNGVCRNVCLGNKVGVITHVKGPINQADKSNNIDEYEEDGMGENTDDAEYDPDKEQHDVAAYSDEYEEEEMGENTDYSEYEPIEEQHDDAAYLDEYKEAGEGHTDNAEYESEEEQHTYIDEYEEVGEGHSGHTDYEPVEEQHNEAAVYEEQNDEGDELSAMTNAIIRQHGDLFVGTKQGNRGRSMSSLRSSWINDPSKALLRRKMGILATWDSKTQDTVNNDLRNKVKISSGCDLSKSKSWYMNEGKWEEIISSMSKPIM